MSGRFWTFEGVEGAGKSSLMAAIEARLRAEGEDPLVTWEPGDSPLGREIRRLLLDGDAPAPWAELFLYLADRAEHMAKRIEPALAAGRTVLCDRFHDATVAYQVHGRGLDAETVRVAGARAAGRMPDRTILLDIDPELGLARASRRGALDRMEREALAFHRRVREGYLALATAEPARFLVLDATRPPEQLVAETLSALGLVR